MKVQGHISRRGKLTLSPSSFTLTETQAKRSIVLHQADENKAL